MEEVLPPQTASGAGFELTLVRQFTVFLENRVGRLQMMLRVLEETTRVVSITIEESADASLVRLICADQDPGRDALRQEGFCFSESDLLCVALPRSAVPLTSICQAIVTAEINIHYMYPLLRPRNGIALYVEDPTLAARLLIAKGFTLLAESDLSRGS